MKQAGGYMTEDKAKRTMCPKLSGNLAVKDSYGDILVEFKRVDCMTSECMWWVWDISRRQAADINTIRDAGAIPSGHCGAIK